MSAARPPSPHQSFPDSSHAACDSALALLAERKHDWIELSVSRRIQMLRQLRKSFEEVSERWARTALAAEHLAPDQPEAAEEWISGPYFVMRNLRLLERALEDIRDHGSPSIPGPVQTRDDGRVTARVFPYDGWDRTLYSGITADVWMNEGVTEESLEGTQALAYQEARPGRVCLVLGAGNVSSIGPMDALYKLFVEHEVVLYKNHPVNDYLGPLLTEGFRPLVEAGYLRLVYGGAELGAYLTDHPEVDTIHITGSDKTVDAIVFGPGDEGRSRKKERRPRLTKPIASELGNVSPLVVVPGGWTPRDLQYQAENIVTSLANNAGFNCNATRVVILHREWPQAEALLDEVRKAWSKVRPRYAYYPGARQRFETFLAAHPEAERFGDPGPDELPWIFITGLAPDSETLCFDTEAFCSVTAQMALPATTVGDFLSRAVAFCNERLWGTLSMTLLVDPVTEVELADDVDRAIAELRYGTVSINHWAALGFGLGVTPWGARPGHDLYDIQSGTGVVHNTLMFSEVQKCVLRAPFRPFPRPPWIVGHKTAHRLTEKLTRFEASPSILKLPSVFASALLG